MNSLKKQVREVLEQVDRFRSICKREAFIDSMHKKIPHIVEEEHTENALEDTGDTGT